MQIPQPPAAAPADTTLTPAPEPRRLPAGQGAAWWSESWRIFKAAPGPWIGILIAFLVISVLLMAIPVVGGFLHSVVTPVFVGGVMLGCHALARGEPLRVGHLFAGFEGGRFMPLCVLGLLWLAVLVGIMIVIVLVVYLTLGAAGLAALQDFAGTGPLDYAALASGGFVLLILVLVALAVALLVAMAYWFAPALVVLNGEQPVAALKKSFAASWANFGAFLLYGLIYIGLAIVASIPFGLGWIVLGPMVAGSCYAGWRTIFAKTP
jgi:uncharacterized membrane protein